MISIIAKKQIFHFLHEESQKQFNDINMLMTMHIINQLHFFMKNTNEELIL